MIWQVNRLNRHRARNNQLSVRCEWFKLRAYLKLLRRPQSSCVLGMIKLFVLMKMETIQLRKNQLFDYGFTGCVYFWRFIKSHEPKFIKLISGASRSRGYSTPLRFFLVVTSALCVMSTLSLLILMKIVPSMEMDLEKKTTEALFDSQAKSNTHFPEWWAA